MKFFGKSISFKNPEKVDVVIFDECNSEYLKKVLNVKYSVGIFKMRPYEILIAPSILKNFIKGIRKISLKNDFISSRGVAFGLIFQIRAIYFEACLVAMNPKAVITFIDNNASFHWLSRYSRKFPYIAIQNGSRLRYQVSEDKEFYLQHYFCWGSLESELFHELGYKVERYYPVGSLMASLHFDNISVDSIPIKYDLLIVSTWRGNIGYPVDVIDTMRSMKIMDEILSAYVKVRSIKVAIILRAERDSEHWVMPGIGNEYDYYRSIYGDSVEIIEADFTSRSIYPNMQQSRVIASCLSSALSEAYGIGKKIVFFNYTNTKKYHFDIDAKCIIEEQDFSKVVKLIDELLSQSESEYQRLHLEGIKRVMAYPEGVPSYKMIQSKIDEIINL